MVNRLEKLSNRRLDPEVSSAKLLNEVYRHIEQSESVKYVVGAMQPIDPDYTANTYAEGDRVRDQLDNNLDESCDFHYQGSVTNDTHIKARSDIDLLVIIGKFYTLQKPQVPTHPYKGNPVNDMVGLRANAIGVLQKQFPKVTIDTSGSKSITLEGGSLRRKIDVVPANWYFTNKYAENQNDIYKGVQIFDANTGERIPNTPFLHNALIDLNDKKTRGGIRKAARLMKSLKYDTEEIELSSYDLVSVAYNLPSEWADGTDGLELNILDSCLRFCEYIVTNEEFRNELEVPDGHRKIFAPGHATLDGMGELVYALQELAKDVLQENVRSFTKLAEARIDYR